ncbi:uncharacterized protein LOC119211075 isoform X1 [Tachysurus ichikawai]
METTCMHISVAEDNQISRQLHAFWEIESLGIVHDKSPSAEEAEVPETFEQMNSEKELCTMRMNRVVFRVVSSPFLLAATIRTHLKQYESEQPETVADLRESLYVDDLIASSPDVKKACSITTQAKAILAAAGIELQKWTTISSDLRARWMNDQIESPADSEMHNVTLKVLGLIWRQDHDDFVFNLQQVLDVLKRKKSTKRSVLQISSRIFDPIGFLFPINTVYLPCKMPLPGNVGARSQVG